VQENVGIRVSVHECACVHVSLHERVCACVRVWWLAVCVVWVCLCVAYVCDEDGCVRMHICVVFMQTGGCFILSSIGCLTNNMEM
jgi:hypothetical protein